MENNRDENIEEIERRKDVFAWFGAAAYYAQCFEKELITLLLLVERLKSNSISPADLDCIDSHLSKKTLGQLLRELKKQVTIIDPSFEKDIKVYLKKRNYLAHHFFWEHAADILTPAGCDRMIAELQSLSNTFKEADSIAQMMSRSIGKQLGWAEELMDSWIEEGMKKLRDTKES